jgi:hypothetical protein
MDISNNSFIITSATNGNIVVNPSQSQAYENITLFGNGYYDWGRILNQDLVYIYDQIASLKDGGIQQATFDANQFLAQFQTSQTEALANQTAALLIAIDNKVNSKFADVTGVITTNITDLTNQLSTYSQAYKDADTALQTTITAAYQTAVQNAADAANAALNNLISEYNTFTSDTNNWRASVSPQIAAFSSGFDLFKTQTATNFTSTNDTVSANYQTLLGKISTINATLASFGTGTVTTANQYTDAQIASITDLVNHNLNNITGTLNTQSGEISILQTEVSDFANLIPTFVTTDNNILSSANTYTDMAMADLNAPTGAVGKLQIVVDNLSNNFDTKVHTVVDPLFSAITGTNGSLTLLNADYNAYKASNASDIQTKYDSVNTAVAAVANRVTTIETTYDNSWKAYTDAAIIAVNGNISTLTNNVTTNTNDIANLKTTLDSLNGGATTQQLNITDLTNRVTNLENEINPMITSAKVDTLAAAKSYTDSQVTIIDGLISNGDKATLSSANSYTNTALQSIATTYATTASLDNLGNSINGLQAGLTTLTTNLNNSNGRIDNLISDVNTLRISSAQYVDDRVVQLNDRFTALFSNAHANYVGYDTIFPILKTVLGLVINNQILPTELNDLFDNIIATYKNTLPEQIANNLQAVVYINNGNFNIRFAFDRNHYQTGLNSLQVTDGSTTVTLTSFVPNTSIVTGIAGLSYMLDQASGSVINESMVFGSSIGSSLTATLNYNTLASSSNIATLDVLGMCLNQVLFLDLYNDGTSVYGLYSILSKTQDPLIINNIKIGGKNLVLSSDYTVIDADLGIYHNSIIKVTLCPSTQLSRYSGDYLQFPVDVITFQLNNTALNIVTDVQISSNYQYIIGTNL